VEVEIEPIRVDAKLDIVETEAELGTKSRIHNLAFCLLNLSAFPQFAPVVNYRLLFSAAFGTFWHQQRIPRLLNAPSC